MVNSFSAIGFLLWFGKEMHSFQEPFPVKDQLLKIATHQKNHAQETAFILSNATAQSLVLIDELGRATSTSDGIAIAWAIAEELICIGALTYFATHFAQLGQLAQLYPNCQLWHFGVNVSNGMDFTWQLKHGQDNDFHYGLLLAPLVGLLVHSSLWYADWSLCHEGKWVECRGPGGGKDGRGWNLVIHLLHHIQHAFISTSTSRRSIWIALMEIRPL